MPVYATPQDLIGIYGITEISEDTDRDSTGAIHYPVAVEAIRSGSREIESYADPYGLTPTDVGPDALATPGTFPAWWREAAKDIAVYRMSLDGATYTKEKRRRYEDWRERLMSAYPATVNGDPVGGGKVTIVGGPREFSAGKTAGL